MRESWTAIECDLKRARQLLPECAADDKSIGWYHECLEHNELELACDALEFYANENPVPVAFWIALRDAAIKMNLTDNAARFDRRISN